MNPLVLGAIIFFAIFTQSVSGFGLGLISMALLAGFMDIRVAVPLIALVGLAAELLILARYHHAFRLGSVIRLSLASIIGIPLGVAALDLIDETIVLRLLGVILVAYSAYALLKFRLPTVQHPAWAYSFGFVSGLLGGLYNVGGPPIVIYGTCRCWTPAEFRSNLQGFFIINSLGAILTHALSHNYTPVVWQHFAVALPAIVLGVLVGFALDRYIDAVRFRQIVFVVLALLGIRLIF